LRGKSPRRIPQAMVALHTWMPGRKFIEPE